MSMRDNRLRMFIKDVTIYFLLLLLLYKMVMLALHEHQIKTAEQFASLYCL